MVFCVQGGAGVFGVRKKCLTRAAGGRGRLDIEPSFYARAMGVRTSSALVGRKR